MCRECTFTFGGTNNLFKLSVLDTHITRAPFYASPILICKIQKFSHFTFHFTYTLHAFLSLSLPVSQFFSFFSIKSLIAAFTFDVQKVEWNKQPWSTKWSKKNKRTLSRDIYGEKKKELYRDIVSAKVSSFMIKCGHEL